MHPQLRFVAGALLLATSIFAQGADIGQIKRVSGAVSLERAGQTMPAALGTKLQASDTIVTGSNGMIGITLTDDSLLSAGPNSRLELARYAFDLTTHQGAFDATLHAGTLSMISGKLSKQSPDAVKVKTPTAVLAVRGTEFYVQVDDGSK